MSVNLTNPDLFFNRELSWLKFNERVLEEANDTSHPLLERLKFLGIFSSNLDEFFMIRVAGLHEQIAAGIHELPADGLRPRQQLEHISAKVHADVKRQSAMLQDDVLPKLNRRGIRIRHYNALTPEQKTYFRAYFKDKIFPVLTPLAVDPAHPFPQLRNLGLNLLIEVRDPNHKKEHKIAVLPIPSLLPRFIPVPGKNKGDHLLLEDLLIPHMDLLFPNLDILDANVFRITRNADMDLSEAEADDLLKLIEKELRKRRLGSVIRLEVSIDMRPESRQFLQTMTGLNEHDIYDIEGPIDIAAFMFLHDLDYPDMKDAVFTPALKAKITRSYSIFDAIREGGILLHHPYDSFSHVIDLVQESARDPKVMAIKITLYRTSGKSPIVQALKDAAAKGKQVTALIELKARFDEETNIVWAKELERAGVNVVYGLLGLKTHCKITMIVRQEDGQIRRYVHVSTGNYNGRTARIYTDLGMMTCDEAIGKDASELFNLLTGYSGQKEWRKFLVAPVNMREQLHKLIQACIQAHTPEQPSLIRMVMNSLVDPEMIEAFYRASMAGIKVELVVRGICCLKPGIEGISDNITVRSIVGRFLEHCRIYQFQYGGIKKIYMGSADLMQRNLNRRVELLFPVDEPAIMEKVELVASYLFKDNVKARILQPNGDYLRVPIDKDDSHLNCQTHFLQMAHARQMKIDTISEKSSMD